MSSISKECRSVMHTYFPNKFVNVSFFSLKLLAPNITMGIPLLETHNIFLNSTHYNMVYDDIKIKYILCKEGEIDRYLETYNKGNNTIWYDFQKKKE